jgi:hypothetical protein
MRRLLGPLSYLMDLDTRYRGGCAVVSDGFYNKAVFLGIRPAPAVGRNLRIVGACHHGIKISAKTLIPFGLSPNCFNLLPSGRT